MDHLLPSYPDFKLKTHHHTSTKTLLNIRDLLRAFIFKHAGHVGRALRRAKSLLLDLLSKKAGLISRHSNNNSLRKKIKNNNNSSKKPCSASKSILNLLPVPPSSETAVDGGLVYYDSSWNTMLLNSEQHGVGEFAGYIEWLEENDEEEEEEGGYNEIDRLAEKFIASCHERFMLEKQESYRRYQDMLARSL